MQKKWILNTSKTIENDILDIVKNEFLAKLLLKRGIDSQKKVSDFFSPLKMSITTPNVFVQMEKAVQRILCAIESQEKILIWGDFDADGVTSTALMYKTLKFLGANIEYYIPSREFENHGLNTKALVKLISQKKIKLVITVDCGVSCINEIKFLNSFKVDTIITDHHDYTGELPDALAIINPKVENNLIETLTIDEIKYLSYLAGVGVTFKLACALLNRFDKNEFIDEILPLVAVGTIADVVPILGENRCFVLCGLTLIKKGKNKGLSKLLEVSGYKPEHVITSENIAFGLAPRINAAGRLATVDSAIKLLISENPAEIEICCHELNDYNKIRQELCDKTFVEAMNKIEKEPQESCIVLFCEDWHIGVIGIVASKLVEKYSKPTFLMTKSDDEPNIIRCSARGISGINLYETIKANENLFENFGGHEFAAGLGFDINKVNFETVKKALNNTVKEATEGVELKPILDIDLELESKDLNFELIDLINQLQPFGEGNNSPIFVINKMTLKSFRTIGANNNHLKLQLEKDGKIFEALWWDKKELPIEINEKLDVAFQPVINEFNGQKNIQIMIQDIHYEEKNINLEITHANCAAFKIYDHRKKTDIYKQVAEYCIGCSQSISIFAERKEIINKLSSYAVFSPFICSRLNLKESEQLMFFDFPTSEKLLLRILKTTKAKKIHFMNYQQSNLELDELLKNFSGLLKYSHNNKNGELYTPQLSSILCLTCNWIRTAVELFAEQGIINIKNKINKQHFIIEFLQAKELKSLKTSSYYKLLSDEIESIKKFQTQLLTCNLDEFVSELNLV